MHQLQRYVQDVRTQVQREVRGVLAAPDITTPALKQLRKLKLEFVKVTALPIVEAPDLQPHLFNDT